MNLHVPQSEETRAELSQIAWVPRQIISPQANKPVMGIVQDTLLGIRKFTLRDCFLEWKQVQNILLWLPNWDGIVPTPALIKPKPLWTGKQILSMTLPKGINIAKRADEPSPIHPTDEEVIVENGEILCGIIVKKMAGASANGFIDVIFREKGPEAARDWISNVQLVVNYFLFHSGFSVGIGDTIADKHVMGQISDALKKAKDGVLNLISWGEMDAIKRQPGMTIRETFEAEATKLLNEARDFAGKVGQKSLKDDNNVKQMVVSGSKGSFINISQMSALVGQQIVEGKRIPFGFRHRTLPHFAKDDYGTESRGFVENSYLRGLTPAEFFFHAMGGREGLIDTAIKTAETGYIQRRLVKALEDVKVCYDGTVRNAGGDILQFVYGEDGMDAAFMENQTLHGNRLDDQAFQDKYRIDLLDPRFKIPNGVLQVGIDVSSPDLQISLDEEWAQLREDRRMLRTFIMKDNVSSLPLPVNISRIIQNGQQIFHLDNRKPSDLSPQYIVDAIRALTERLIVIHGEDDLAKEAQYNATLLFSILLRSNLASRVVLIEHRLNRETFDWVCGEVEAKFNQSLVNAGEMCGVLAAQSIGEPATQMTLNTFHYAGVSSKNVTLGVPRLKEVMNVATNIKTPSLTVFLTDEMRRTIDTAKMVQTELEHATLRTVTAAVEVIFDPNPQATVIEDDKEFVEGFFAMPDEGTEEKLDRMSPWVLRLELDRAKMLDKDLEIDYVASKISDKFQDDLHVIYSDQNSEKLVIRCRTISDEADKDDPEVAANEDTFLKTLEAELLDKIDLRGIPGIQRVFMTNKDDKLQVVSERGQWEKVKEWYLETDGSNFKRVLAVDGVDAERTYSNNCTEIYETLGVEAGRAALYSELHLVISFGGSYVNYRHLSLLCDLMTQRGKLMSITRHGINRTDAGALSRCSFEETVEILMEAAAIGDADDCMGVAENVLLGQVAHMGTGMFDVSLDMEMLKDVIVDHRLPVQAMLAAREGGMTPGLNGGMTPVDSSSPMGAFNHVSNDVAFSPIIHSGSMDDAASFEYMGYGQSPMGAGGLGGMSPHGYSPSSPSYSPTSPFMPTSPFHSATSPFATSPFHSTSGMGTSPGYSPASPLYSPASPSFSPASPSFSPASPSFSPASPSFSPASPSFSPASPSYSPTSPRYSPASPAFNATSPSYSPASPRFSPVSPAGPSRMSPTSPAYSPASPAYSPTSPTYSPASPSFSPASPSYSPASPSFSPASPAFSPASPKPAGSTSGGAVLSDCVFIMPIYGKTKYLPNPIPYRLYPKIRNPVNLPLLPRSTVPNHAIVEPKTYVQARTESLAYSPAKMLAARQASSPETFPPNLRIQNWVDSREAWGNVPRANRKLLMGIARRH
ncbi:beta and beta-prime subunits of dna dependent rna-polymerase [Phaffia rhodozyma]|uniref:DNA-directed RNA polymerase n=1 Tax=Phaffia rhodozyma TaxID=264483 RepID=A0A0F7SNT0_PHARH|nr:beta and beta-prime subunits of dna dependent rna-polymerase [Phaffia rhodozyma]